MNKALLIIDVQKAFDNPAWGQRNNPIAESNIERLLTAWRSQSNTVIHVKHNSTDPQSLLRKGAPGNAFKAFAKPLAHEALFEKSVNSAFIGNHLESYLKEQEIQELVIVGLTTDHCVSTSVRMAANLGFTVYLVEDATATFDRKSYDGTYYSANQMHQINLASLNGEFCTVLNTTSALEFLNT